MDDAHDGPYAREPQIEDLIRLAQALNEHGVRYVLIGGFAVIAHGGARTTKDIDLLIDAGPENVARVRSALQILEDKAVNDVADDDLTRYSVVRVADEIVVDLMAKACGVDYADASRDATPITARSVRPCTSSIGMNWPSSVSAGVVDRDDVRVIEADAARASCSNRLRRSVCGRVSAGSRLSATDRPSRVSVARYTSPMPPRGRPPCSARPTQGAGRFACWA